MSSFYIPICCVFFFKSRLHHSQNVWHSSHSAHKTIYIWTIGCFVATYFINLQLFYHSLLFGSAKRTWVPAHWTWAPARVNSVTRIDIVLIRFCLGGLFIEPGFNREPSRVGSLERVCVFRYLAHDAHNAAHLHTHRELRIVRTRRDAECDGSWDDDDLLTAGACLAGWMKLSSIRHAV